MSKQADKREALKESIWPGESGYHNPRKGWFKGRRTLPLLLALLKSKKVSGRQDPSSVYLELLSRHYDEGLVELEAESDHAFAAGYTGKRAVRTWHERIRLLEDLNFIKTKEGGTQRYKYVLLLSPFRAIALLQKRDKIPSNWLNVFQSRCIETGEKTAEQFQSYFEDRPERKSSRGVKSPSSRKSKPSSKY